MRRYMTLKKAQLTAQIPANTFKSIGVAAT